MARRRLRTGAFVITALMTLPPAAGAGIGEIIFEMSGPQMIGVLSGCRLSFERVIHECTVFGYPLPWRSTPEKVWLVLESGVYFSTGKNAGEEPNELDFRGFQTFMLSFDPMLGFRSRLGEHAIGASYNFVFGENFSSFSNVAVKVRPVVVEWAGLKWEYNIRLYPRGFDGFNTPDGAGLVKADDFEAVNAISVTWDF